MSSQRTRNARGQGSRLAEEIVGGALSIIEREGGSDGVTLRAVAREIGIAAPSIYAHFDDREAILRAVIEHVFEELTVAVLTAVEDMADRPLERLVAGCEAYVEFGMTKPVLYRTVFAREMPDQLFPGPNGKPTLADVTICTPAGATAIEIGGQAFAVLVDAIQECIDHGLCAGPDAFAAATSVWAGLHGAVTLWTPGSTFPWPEREPFLRRMILALASAPTDS